MDPVVIDIRNAAPADAETLSELHGEAWHGAYRGIIPALSLERMIARRGSGWWRHAISAAPRSILVLAFGDRLAGYASIGPARMRIAGHEGEIYEIYLRPEFQGVGLGARLFRTARQRLDASGRRGHVVWALADNGPACAFYEALQGYRAAVTKERLGGRVLDKIAYCWR
jgi:ribosomal protein S18 acetylase RimI-like enzyme